MAIFNSYVSLPEGIFENFMMILMIFDVIKMSLDALFFGQLR